jgi:hypothetical protein
MLPSVLKWGDAVGVKVSASEGWEVIRHDRCIDINRYAQWVVVIIGLMHEPELAAKVNGLAALGTAQVELHPFQRTVDESEPDVGRQVHAHKLFVHLLIGPECPESVLNIETEPSHLGHQVNRLRIYHKMPCEKARNGFVLGLFLPDGQQRDGQTGEE